MVLLFLTFTSWGYKITFAEQWYKLFHTHFSQSPDDIMENMRYLEEALKADFCNPLYALATIEDVKEWKQYQNLFRMHVCLKLVDLNMKLGEKWNKRVAYFYNAPWKRENLESLEIAEEIYRFSFAYWREALKWAKKVSTSFEYIEEVSYWHDEAYRIETGDLDYTDIINTKLKNLAKVKADFEAMDENTY